MSQAEKSVSAGRRSPRQRGAALLLFMILVVMAALAYLVSNLTPDAMERRRAQKTEEALTLARDALLGYALTYRDRNPDQVYGFLPLPDLGSTRNNNDAGCTAEGCDAANFAGNALNTTVIGRLPWRTLGIEPLRDGHGECLWYAVSGSHQRIQQGVPLNWDTLSHLDIVVANGGAALASVLASAHERPVAVIFSPGPPLPGQDRAPAGGDDVTRCGGNYNVPNYLDPATAAALGGVTNYLAGTNSASGVTDSAAPKGLSLQGRVFASGGNFYPGACPGGDCALVANDSGLPLTGDQLFAALRKHANFRTDINALLDRMTTCLRDKLVAGGFTPAEINGFTPPTDKTAGRIPDDACYDSTKVPLGYYDHYREMIFVAKPGAGNFTVNGDINCAGVLLFANQRGGSQQRVTSPPTHPAPGDKGTISNYLEATNLTNFTGLGTTFGSVGGPILLDLSPPQAVEQDIARCVPVGASFTTVTSPTLGINQLVAYDAASRILTLGRQDITTGFGYNANALFGCAWFSESRAIGSGIRSYFSFQFRKVGTSVDRNGFVFALADAWKNDLTSCGAAASHLGYSGDNGVTRKIAFPKIGIEFDQSRNAGFSESADLSVAQPGRNDPCGTSGCGGTAGFNSHAAIVYWGHESPNAIDGVTRPDDDDNVHGYPSAASLAGVPRSPRSHVDPATETGIKFVNLRGAPDDSRLYHVRVELTPTRNVNADARLSNTSMRIEVWIADNASTSADRIAALKNTTRPMSLLDATFATTISDTPTLYDVPTGNSCLLTPSCPVGEACGSDNMCYRPPLERIQLGFTGSQHTSDQQVEIQDFFTTWLP